MNLCWLPAEVPGWNVTAIPCLASVILVEMKNWLLLFLTIKTVPGRDVCPYPVTYCNALAATPTIFDPGL